MQKLRWQAKLYIWSTIVTGASLYAWHLWHLQIDHPVLLIILSIFAAVTHTLKVEGATKRSSYQISWIAYGASFVLLSPGEALLVLLVAHLVEWLWHKPEWYISLFNVNAFGIVASVSILVWQTISHGSTPFAPISAFGFLATAATFTALNHLLVGLVIWVARGESLMRSGVFHLLTLMIDFVSFGMGIASGLVWLVNPYAVVFILSPLYLIYTTLQVPSLQQQTRIEPKTGLYNAKYFAEALATELERADRFDRPLTIVMADVDLLRNINNTYGHLAGDTVLIGIANILRQAAREYDVVSRFGGEEYAILMPETSLQEALPIIERMRAAVDSARFKVSTNVNSLFATMSFGVAEREHFGQDAEEIIHNADLAVYQSKATTRNRVCYFSGNEIKDYSWGVSPLERANVTPPPEGAPPVVALAKESSERPKPKWRKLEVTTKEAPLTPSAIDHYDKLLGKTSSTRLLPFYLATLTAVALTLFLWTVDLRTTPDWQGILIFVILTFLTEWLAIDIYARNTTVSTSVAPMVAGACLFGAPGVLILTLVIAVASLIKHRSPLNRLIFNTSNHLLGALICVNFLQLTGVVITDHLALAPILVVLTATILNYLTTSILIAGVIRLSSEQSARNVWFERFYWLWPYYVILGLVAYTLALGYLSSGLTGVLVFLIPLLMLRVSQTEYIKRTESMVVQLRTANVELIERSNEISASNEGLILALSRASDLRDPFVHGHALHVVRYAVLIAEELGLPAEQVETIRHAGLLHDIGKIGIPETILFKPAKLTKEEYGLMKQHAALGAALVSEIESLQPLAPFIRHHHEHYNGRGYPAGLAGAVIPLEARILSVADAVEAMASDRPYRKALTPEAILEELQKHSGTQFDPTVVDAFTRVIKAQGEGLIVNSASNIIKVIEGSAALNSLITYGIGDNALLDNKLLVDLFSAVPSELDNMNMALHRAFAAHRRMELSAQEGKDLAETLLHVASTINTTLEQDRVLALILEQLAHVVQYDNASIMLLEEDTLNAVARRSIHVPESQFLSVPIGKLAHVSEVIDHQRAVVITDTYEDSRWMRRQGSENIRCWLGVPLVVQGRVIGVLNLSNSIPGSYTDHHLQVAVAFAAHAALAIQNARLYTQAQQEIEERERAQAALRQSQANLQSELMERLRAEQELQEERSLLAQRVQERTAELTSANAKLTAALRTKDEFLATVSHELRTPLNAILLLTESMQNGVYGALESRHADVLGTVKQSARHLLSLINDILDMSKIESGMFELDMGPVSLPIICRNGLQLVAEAARAKQLELKQTIDENVDMVNGDERRLLQILVNLLSNAVKFTPDGGTVGLEVVGDAKAKMVHITVWDTGIGIAKDDMARLFQPFVQLDSKLSRQYEGTGLGLALVDRLTKMHGGHVLLTSEVGKGSRFTISIPWKVEDEIDLLFQRLPLFANKTPPSAKMHDTNGHNASRHSINNGVNGHNTNGHESLKIIQKEHPARKAEVCAPADAHNHSPLILLVEDNEIGIEAMQDYLMAHSYRVIIARNGEEAIAQTNQCHPDLILMDIQMPDMDGLEATSRIRAQDEFTDIPIIALTALAMPGDRERCIQAGATEYLSKPVSMKQLVHVIQSQLHLEPVLAT